MTLEHTTPLVAKHGSSQASWPVAAPEAQYLRTSANLSSQSKNFGPHGTISAYRFAKAAGLFSLAGPGYA
jgi:hypothetical protein